MKRFTLLKTMLLLCALIVGSVNVWATDATFNWASGGNMGSNATGKVGNITLTGAANSASNAPAVTSNTLRLYAYRSSGDGASATFTADNGYKISAIEVTSSNGGSILKYDTDNGSSFSSGFSWSDGVATVSGLNVTSITLKNCQNSGKNNTTIQISKVIITYASSSSTPSSDVAFANATRSLDLKNASSFTQTATTADGYAGTAGASVTYSMTVNTAGATINSSTGEVTPTKAGSVTVQADAAAIAGKFLASTATYTLTVTDTREWDVTFHVGNNTSVETRTSGATLSLDDPAAICGMSFVGWSSTDDVASPIWVDNSTKVTANMELYAMFEAVAGEYSYRLVESSQADWRGDYLIAYSSTIFADGRVGGTSGMGANGGSVNPGTKLSGKVVDVTWGDTYNVTIEAINDSKLSDGYLLKTKDGKYNYQTSNANGLASTDNRATAVPYPLSVTFNSSSDIDIANSAGAQFHYNAADDGYFRFYKDGGQNNVYLYKKTTDVAPVYSLGHTESIPVSLVGWATYCSEYALDFTNVTGLTAYTASVDGTAVKFTEVTGKVPAKTGLLVSGTTADVPVCASADPVVNLLEGVTIETVKDAESIYVLMIGDKGLGFYKNTNAFTVRANSAYLPATSVPSAESRSFISFDDETTGIEAINSNPETVKENAREYYNLNGQRVTTPTKGLYIVNGKKVIINK